MKVLLITIVNVFSVYAAVFVREARNTDETVHYRSNGPESLDQDYVDLTQYRSNNQEPTIDTAAQAWNLKDQLTGSYESYADKQDDTCSNTCDAFLEKAIAAVTTEAKIEIIEKDILPSTIKDEISDKVKGADSEAKLRAVYELLATYFKIRVTDGGFKTFTEAVSEISVAKEEACTSTEFASTKREFSRLINEFVKSCNLELRDKHLLESAYGKLLCLKEHEETHTKDKCKCPPDGLKSDFSSLKPCNFFACLDSADVIDSVFFSSVLVDYQCLAFVVDTTGSMSEEINTAKSLIHNFLKSEQDIGIDGCYILVPFNDVGGPHSDKSVAEKSVGPITYAYSHDADELKSFYDSVQSLRAYGGGDTPEYAFHAMHKAMEVKDTEKNFSLMIAGSQMVVLTDAPSKQKELESTVIDLAKSSDICIHFFSATHISEYERIAESTHGTVISPFDQWKFANFAASYRNSPCEFFEDSLPEVDAAESCKSFSVSRLAGNLRVVVSTPSSTSIIVTRPDGKKIEKTAVDSNLAFFVEKDPTSGSWSVCSKSGSSINTKVVTDYLFDVSIFYYTESTTGKNLSSIIPSCSTGKITVVTSVHKDIKSASLQIIKGGPIFKNIKLTKNCDHGYFLSETINFPDPGTYTYHFVGTDVNGYVFDYELSSPVKF